MKYALILVFVLLAGCRDETASTVPDPAPMTEESVAYFCQMALVNMPGPKAQAFLQGTPDPIFFAQVRDGIAYLKQPERTAEILVVYVSDMGRAESWDNPGPDNWINANDAYFVVGADVKGGMGAPEIAPFASRDQAQAFADEKGGKVMQLDAIPDTAVLGPVDRPSEQGS